MAKNRPNGGSFIFLRTEQSLQIQHKTRGLKAAGEFRFSSDPNSMGWTCPRWRRLCVRVSEQSELRGPALKVGDKCVQHQNSPPAGTSKKRLQMPNIHTQCQKTVIFAAIFGGFCSASM